jgi:hypothetical protein
MIPRTTMTPERGAFAEQAARLCVARLPPIEVEHPLSGVSVQFAGPT